MLFNSYIFIFVFLPIVLAGFYFIHNKRIQLPYLFLCSIFFYAYWSKTFVFLLLFTVILDFYFARTIFISQNQRLRKFLLILSITINFSVLGFFKYYDFFATSINDTLSFVHQKPLVPLLHLILPIGISFYTFQSMSYVIDVYRRTSSAHAGLLEFASYVTFFPHQISGPLVRHNVIVPQLENASTYVYHSDHFWRGLYFFIFGLSKKVLIADRIAPAIDPIILNMANASNLEAWLAMLGYSMQLYFDFSGYSDMAVGLGLLMNIQFPQNFNSPYKSTSVTEFWRRWHITLSSWLRDYLYISLGGNRRGHYRTYINLFLTMLIGGLWHGANWTFVAWGFLHGSALVAEKSLKPYLGFLFRIRFVSWLSTFFFTCLAWIFFRSPNFTIASIWLKKIFFINYDISMKLFYLLTKYKDRFYFALGLACILAFFSKNTWENDFPPSLKRAALLALLFVICLTYLGQESPFLYFQF
ncbi:MAG: MBOAT family protein [Bdellovibrionaceae bacterium]|nr:MBOAT family protein [Pseudobdellovibrionaceae bacterium]